MRFKLSVCDYVGRTKEDYAWHKDFTVQSFDTDDTEALASLFKTKMVSNRVWKSGLCEGAGYEGCYGTMLDFDDGKPSLEQFCSVYAKYNFIIYTSTNHQMDVASHGGVQDRFRVLFPSDSLSLLKREDFLLAGECINRSFSYSDPSCNSDLARKFYPSCGDNPKYKLIVNINDSFQTWSPKLIEARRELASKKAVSAAVVKADKIVAKAKEIATKVNKSCAFSRDEKVVLSCGSEKVINELVTKTPCYCPFCNDKDTKSPSAFVSINKLGRYYIVCTGSGCNGPKSKSTTYWEDFNVRDAVMDLHKCWFDASAGRVATMEDGRIKYFVLRNDWESYCEENDIPLDFKVSTLPRLTADFSPALPEGYCFESRKYNIFIEPAIEKGIEGAFPNISFLINNIVEKELVEPFYNWLAYQLQTRKKPTTGWILSTERRGAGKELFVQHVLKRLFGDRQVVIEAGDRIEDRFNSMDITTWIKVFDEVFARGDFKANLARNEKIKTLIGSENIIIEPKGVNKMAFESHIGYIFLTNQFDPVMIEDGDRRYNFSRIEKHEGVELVYDKWFESKESVESRLGHECPAFANYLYNLTVDEKMANTPTNTTRREQLVQQSKPVAQQFAEALRDGDWEWFDPETNFTLRAVSEWVSMVSKVDVDNEILEFKNNLKEGFMIGRHYQFMGQVHLKVRTSNMLSRKLEQYGHERGVFYGNKRGHCIKNKWWLNAAS